MVGRTRQINARLVAALAGRGLHRAEDGGSSRSLLSGCLIAAITKVNFT
jgi:hypothetical protein